MSDEATVDSQLIDAVATALEGDGAPPALTPAAREQARAFVQRLEQQGLSVTPAGDVSALRLISDGFIDLFSSEDRKLKYSSLLVLFVVLVVLYVQPLVILFGLLLSGVIFFIQALRRDNAAN
ncbi:hypothetical protein B0W47_10835 [Komagataeibacter nataicola]|uniref:Uncharacterized protein n=1 Tax=Komagataeibacter nataicola TaxID=265960 RepID=A0A9N7CYH0_9PROT|nr:hypothetical protein [Komagataeibacter nataicola]AQU87886.1 hypothetical protein B0W47_10835 [Komagataeibacter nataicola]PYD66446.1 hypothetical protein CDI09_08070 [Komagataeibacter nataicola]WEQ55625.1 hypothetical protein LV564_16420 [Komagataeibacter nataicola]